jgi:two-component system sensor histidine kinase MprB
MSIRTRVTLVAAVAVAGIATLLAAVSYLVETRDLRRQVEVDLWLRATTLAEELRDSGEVEPPVDSPFGSTVSYAQIVDADGRVTPLASGTPALPVERGTLEVAQGRSDRFYSSQTVESVHLRTLTLPLGPGKALQTARPVDHVDLQAAQFGGLLVVLVLVGTAAAVLLGRLVARSALRPVAQLTAAAQAIATQQDLTRRITVAGDVELEGLAESINSMVASLDESLQTQQQLVADASHELQTPLTVLRANVGLLQRAGGLEPEQRRRLLGDIDAELANLSRLLANLVDLARDPTDVRDRQLLALDEVIADVVATAGNAHPRVHIAASLEPTEAEADLDQVMRMARNLIDNAAAWSPEGGTVEVTLADGVLTVRDHGPGIAPEDLPKIFRRFYRAPAARDRPGSGLGLAIVQKAAAEHGWVVTAANASGGGAVFTVELRGARTAGVELFEQTA